MKKKKNKIRVGGFELNKENIDKEEMKFIVEEY